MNKKHASKLRKIFFILVMALVVRRVVLSVYAQEVQPTVVPIENSSFEPASPLTPPGYPSDQCGIRSSTVPGWTFGAGSGVIQLFNPNPCGIALPPDGATVAIAGYGSRFSQNLGISPLIVQKPSPGWKYVTEGNYTLNFSVANYFHNYPGYYTAEIDFGTQELCEASGWGTGNFSRVTLTCPGPGYLVIDKSLPNGGPVQGSQNFVVKFSVNGWTLLFDNMSFTFTPN